jgi:hypothetical protein
MEWIGSAVVFPLSWLFGLKYTRLRIPTLIAGATPVAVLALGKMLGLATGPALLPAISSTLGMFLGASTCLIGLTGGIACGKSTLVN